MKIWDISKQTYRISSTLTFNSFAGSMDVVADSKSAVSGHSDGSLLFWDLETAQKTAELKGTLLVAHVAQAITAKGKRIFLHGTDTINDTRNSRRRSHFGLY